MGGGGGGVEQAGDGGVGGQDGGLPTPPGGHSVFNQSISVGGGVDQIKCLHFQEISYFEVRYLQEGQIENGTSRRAGGRWGRQRQGGQGRSFSSFNLIIKVGVTITKVEVTISSFLRQAKCYANNPCSFKT